MNGKASAKWKARRPAIVHNLIWLSGERPECTDNVVALYFTGFAPVAQFTK
jgi:hypothetical protein